MKIIPQKDAAQKAFDEIKDLREGKIRTVKTGLDYLDNIYPVLNGSVITIAAGSGVGKSYELELFMDNVMDLEKNPESVNYAFLHVNLEMKMRSIMLREVSKKLKMSKRKIIEGAEFSEEQIKKLKAYRKKVIKDERIFISDGGINPESYAKGCREFLDAHKDKSTVFIALDHLALVKGGKGGMGKQAIIEAICEETNDIKMEYENVIFVFLSQLNGDMIKRMRDKDITAKPTQTDLYYSGFIFQVSDYVMVKVAPYPMGVTEYLKVNPNRYSYLSKFFTGNPDSKGRRSLRTAGVIYRFLLKCREAEDGFYDDIYAEDMNIPDIASKIDPVQDIDNSEPSFPAEVNHNTPGILNSTGAEFETPSFEGDSEEPAF